MTGLSGLSGLSGLIGGQPPRRFVNPTTGNDANDGKANLPGRAWASFANVSTTPAGDWDRKLSTLLSTADRQQWGDDWYAGRRKHTGTHIYLDTSGGTPLILSARVDLGKRFLIGVNGNDIITSAKTLPNTGWTNPTGTVWKLAAGGTPRKHAGVYFGGVLGTGVGGFDTYAGSTAAIHTALQANTPSFYPDPATGDLYISIATNPNSDGLVRTWVQDVNGATDSPLFTANGGALTGVYLRQNFLYDPSSGSGNTTGSLAKPISLNMGSSDATTLSVIDHCQSDVGKHGFELADGNGSGTATGLFITTHDTATGPPTGTFAGAFSGFVTFYNGLAGTAVTYARACVDNGSGMISHNAGGSGQFAAQVVRDSTITGTLGLSAETSSLVMANNSIALAALVPATITSTSDTVTDRTPQIAGTATFTNPVFHAGTGHTDTPSTIAGTITFNTPTIDLTTGNLFTTAWTRGGTYSVTINNGSIKLINNVTYGLIETFTAGTDAFAAVGLNIIGPAGLPLIHNYNGTGNPKSWFDAFTLGWLTSCTHNGIPFAAPTPPASILAVDMAAFWNFKSAEQWTDSTWATVAQNTNDPIAVVADSYYGNAAIAVSSGQRPLVSSAGAVFDAVDDGMDTTVNLLASTGWCIAVVEKLTGVAGSRRTVQSNTQGQRLISIGRNDGNNAYAGGLVSSFAIAPDGARHVALLNCPSTGLGNLRYIVDGTNRTNGTVAATDWGQLCFGKGSGGSAANELAATTVQYCFAVKRFLTPTEETALSTYLAGLP